MSEALTELELRMFLARLLAGEAESDDEQLLSSDRDLALEVERRLEACGVRLHRKSGQAPICVIESENDGLSELSRAALALCAIALRDRGGDQKRPRLEVEEIRKRVGSSYSAAYLRRAALGPLESRGLIRVIRPEQRASRAYIVAGPALGAVDADALIGQLDKLGSGSRND